MMYMNLQPFEMPGDPAVAGVLTCLFWEVVCLSAYAGLLVWLRHHVGKTAAGSVLVAVVGLLASLPAAILQTRIAIPLLNMYTTEIQSVFLVGMLALDGTLAVCLVLGRHQTAVTTAQAPMPPPPSTAPSGRLPTGQPSTAPTAGTRPAIHRGTP